MVDLTQTANPFEIIYTVGGFFAVCSFLVLLLFAIRDANRVEDLPPDHPDRMVANDAVLNEVTRFLLTAGILAIGVSATLTPPARGTTEREPSVLGVVLFAVLLFWEAALILWGLKDLWFRRRLFHRMANVRLVCIDSTYPACPFLTSSASTPQPISPESLVEPPSVPPSLEEEP